MPLPLSCGIGGIGGGCRPRGPRYNLLQHRYRHYGKFSWFSSSVTVCKLWVVNTVRESFERNSVSSYFDKLLEANTVWGSLYYSAVAGYTGDSSKLHSAHSEGNVSIICIVFICFLACYTYQSDL
jgi:hypothetical protein